MNRILLLVGVSLLSFVFVMCNKEDPIEPTGVSGRPSGFVYSNKSQVAISYNDGRINKIIQKNDGTIQFFYEGDWLSAIEYTGPENVQDGWGRTTFKKQDENMIRIESTSTPDFLIYIQEMVLNEKQLPVKITYDGAYEWNGESLILEEKIDRYTLFVYDDQSRLISMYTYSNIDNFTEESEHSFSYEDSPGIVSQINMPDWFFVYWNHNSYTELHTRMFLSYQTNLLQERVKRKENEMQHLANYNYSYQYNKEDFPVKVTSELLDGSTVSVLY